MKGKVQWCTKAQQKLQTERIARLESTQEREAKLPAAEDARPACCTSAGCGPGTAAGRSSQVKVPVNARQDKT